MGSGLGLHLETTPTSIRARTVLTGTSLPRYRRELTGSGFTVVLCT